MKRIGKWISNHSLLIVIISLVMLIPAVIGYVCTDVNYDILTYLPEDIETIQGQNILTNDFGIGAYAFVMTDSKNTSSILKLEDELKEVENVNAVVSLADVTGTTIPLSMLPDEILDKLTSGDETVIMVTFSTGTSEEATMDSFEEIRDIVGDANKVGGMTAMILDTKNLSNEEIIAYVLLAVLFCLIVLTLATDSFIIPFLLLGNIGVAILYNMGSNIILGNISYITKAITAVLQLGVTMDFSIFLYHKYEQKKEEYKDKKDAMAEAIHETFISVLGSSLTTVAGFLALCSMELTLGKDIGIVMAKGVVWGVICVMTLFPALLLTFDNLIEKTKHKSIFPEFKHLQKFSIKYFVPILIVFALICVPAYIGNKNVEVYYKLDNSLPEDLPCRITNSELAEKYNIVSPEIILIDKDIKTNDLKELVDELNNVEGIDMVLSPMSLNDFGVPTEMLPEELVSIVQNDEYQLIILNSSYEVASDELNSQIDEINKIVKTYDENAITAGEGALTKDLVEIADHDFKWVNYISIAVIFVLMLLVLKSIALPILLVIAIETAIFINMAISYYTGVTLPFIASICIGTIQLGATIDYAILMSTTYLSERKVEKDKKKALSTTLAKTVPSIIVSALCFFAATLGVSIYSQIDMIGSICTLLSRGSIISALIVTIVVPALLLVFDKVIMKTTKGMKGC